MESKERFELRQHIQSKSAGYRHGAAEYANTKITELSNQVAFAEAEGFRYIDWLPAL
jgi:hypothetical protein